MLIRDVVGPENRNLGISLWCADTDGQDISAQQLAEHRGREADWLRGQTAFYRSTHDYVRQLGFKGLIHDSNWATADPATT